MVKTSAQPYKHIIHVYVYNHIQRTACLAGQQQHKVFSTGE